MAESFTKNAERDGLLVFIAMEYGREALLHQTMQLPEFEGGPDRVTEHGDWLRKQDEEYKTEVSDVTSRIYTEKGM